MCGRSDAHRRLALPVHESLLDSLADKAGPAHRDYRIECFTGPVPEHFLASLAELSASLVTEALERLGELQKRLSPAGAD